MNTVSARNVPQVSGFGFRPLTTLRMPASLTSKMANWAGKELCNVGSQDQQGEQENDACHLGAEGFPEQHKKCVQHTHNPTFVMRACLPFSNLRPLKVISHSALL